MASYNYMMSADEAVSYTHLDVYKRQEVYVQLLRQLLLKNLTQLLERSPEFVCQTESK